MESSSGTTTKVIGASDSSSSMIEKTRVITLLSSTPHQDKEVTRGHLNLTLFSAMFAVAKAGGDAGRKRKYLKQSSTKSSVRRKAKPTAGRLFLGDNCSRYYLLLLISIFLLIAGHGSLPPVCATSPQQTALSTPATPQQYPAAPVTTGRSSPTLSVTTSAPVNKLNSSSQSQPTSLKFTLIAGKFWKFNIKANSFSSHKESGELRLHRNVSLNNYIIDDDYWFQYNPQQQQLFAWPSLLTKPGTYYFVLLPSGTDIEADSENAVGVDVVANIVVELIRPLYQGTAARNDIDLLIDHKFSLDYLHRHPSYPLLLNQIVSVFQVIAPRQQISATTSTTTTTVSPTTTTTLATILQKSLQNKQTLANKLSDIILLNSTYSPDGDLFSLTWSSHPSLANSNTIVPMTECRLATINETVTKLSTAASATQSLSPASAIDNIDEKLVIFYPLSASLLNNQQAIVPTERGDFSLKLTLNGPCQSEGIVEKLIGSRASQIARHKNEVPSSEAATSLSSNESLAITAAPRVIDVTFPPPVQISPSSESIDSTSAASTAAPLDAASKFAANDSSATASTTPPTSTHVPPTSVTTPANTSSESPALSVIINSPSEPAVQKFSKLTPANETITPVKAPPVLESEAPSRKEQQQQQPPLPNPPSKSQPQTKSFADLLEVSSVNDISEPKAMTTNSTTTTMPRLIDAADSIGPPTYVNASLNQTLGSTARAKLNDTVVITNATSSNELPLDALPPTTLTKETNQVPSDSSLDEDLLGILNDVMEYFISYAIPISIVVGFILLVSIIFALISLCMKRRRSQQFQVKNRFKFRYGSERRAFLKNSSKPVILDADQKSLSLSGTPQHRAKQAKKSAINKAEGSTNITDDTTYYPMHMFSYGGGSSSYTGPNHDGGCDAGGDGGGCD